MRSLLDGFAAIAAEEDVLPHRFLLADGWQCQELPELHILGDMGVLQQSLEQAAAGKTVAASDGFREQLA